VQNELSTLGHNIETEFLVNKESDNFQFFYVSFMFISCNRINCKTVYYLYHNVLTAMPFPRSESRFYVLFFKQIASFRAPPKSWRRSERFSWTRRRWRSKNAESSFDWPSSTRRDSATPSITPTASSKSFDTSTISSKG